MRRHPEDIARAAALTRRGVQQKQIAAEIGVSPKQIQRWARDPRYAKLFEPPPEPGSLEDLRRVHLEALEATLADGRKDHATRQRAAEALHKLTPTSDRGSGSGRVTIYAAPPGQPFPTDRCPSCGAMLLSPDGDPLKVVHGEVVPEE
jgi:transcriptional regulator with XRE-family HTH domain